MKQPFHQLKYTYPMHPEIIRDEPGNRPKCDMDLVPLNPESMVYQSSLQKQEKPNPRMDHTGHDHHGMMIDDFKQCFYAVLSLTIPIMLFTEVIKCWLKLHIQFL
jgi:Cu2+-exporting ATPase